MTGLPFLVFFGFGEVPVLVLDADVFRFDLGALRAFLSAQSWPAGASCNWLLIGCPAAAEWCICNNVDSFTAIPEDEFDS